MRIGIDARFLTHPQAGGFKTYTSNLVQTLPVADRQNTYILYTDRPPVPGAAIPRGPNVIVRVIAGQLPAVGMIWREQFALSHCAFRDRLDVFHAPCLTAPLWLTCPLIVTIHDMIWARPPLTAWPVHASRRLMDYYYRVLPELAVRRAVHIITVSYAAKAEIVAGLGIAPELVSVTYEGFSTTFAPLNRALARAKLAAARGITGAFVLAIGSADPRKNMSTLLAAYATLPAELRAQYALVVVWTHRRLYEATAAEAKRLGVRDRVRFLTEVSDEELALLYNAATVFAFPSLYEGFGLPLLEAMACGAPILAGDNSSIPEIVGNAALLVDTRDPVALAEGLARLLGDEELRGRLRARGIDHAATFSWASCARATTKIYEYVRTLRDQGVMLHGRIASR